MSSVNKSTLVGNLGRDPQLFETSTGRKVCRLSLATEQRWKNAAGEPQKKTQWHTVVVWGKQAENCHKYLVSGRQVFVEGYFQTRTYKDKEGVERIAPEVVAQNVQFLGSNTKSSAPAPAPQQEETVPDQQEINYQDIPF